MLYRVITNPVNECMYYLQSLNAVQSSCLQLMHVYWFYLIVGMAAHKLRTGQLEDSQNKKVKNS